MQLYVYNWWTLHDLRKTLITCGHIRYLITKYIFVFVIDETSFKLYGSLTELCNDTLCYQETGNFHAKDCIERSCDQCGVHLIKFSTCNEWNGKRFEYIDIKTKHGTKKKLMLVDKTTKAFDMIKYFIKIVQSFVGHNLRSKWQTDQLKYLIENLPTNECFVVHDFPQNCRCIDRVEIQSNYVQRTEVSIHVSLIYRHAILEVDGVSSTHNKHNMRTFLHYITGRKTRPVVCTLCSEVNIRILELDALLCPCHARILRRLPVPM